MNFIGDRTRFSEKLQKSIDEAEVLTRNNTGLHLNIAANYGGRWDVVNACKLIAEEVKSNKKAIQDIDERMFDSFMSLSDLPAPDLLIRTGGEQRISNFLIWQLAYSELYFVDTLWPDFSKAEFIDILKNFQKRDRRFGKV